jgi:sarcosine oxidase gamma subunit
MTLALVVALLAANPTPGERATPAAAAFERVKKLEGNWRSADGSVLSVRVVQGGATVVEQLTQGGRLVSVTIYRLEGAELLATIDAAAHAVHRLAATSPTSLRFEAPGAWLVLATRDAESLKRETRGGAVEFTREYVETLK